jgi:hypothetical protein
MIGFDHVQRQLRSYPMKSQIIIMLFVALFFAGCSKSKGPSKIVNPPTISGRPLPPTGGGTLPPTGPIPPTGPVLPGTGDSGKVQVRVEEGGTVTSAPNIGSCAGRPGEAYCDFKAPRGTVVTLTAQPWAGWAFEEWDNCPGPSGPQCVITLDALSHLKAEFDPK